MADWHGSGDNILAHDMRPRDPNLPFHSPNEIYEPSTGRPKRDFRRKTHTTSTDGEGVLLDKPVKEIQAEHVPVQDARRRKQREEGGFDFLGDSKNQERSRRGQGLHKLHATDDVLQKEIEMKKVKTQEIKAAQLKQMSADRRRRQEERAKEQQEALQSIQHDPWTKPDQVVPKEVLVGERRAGRRNLVARGSHFQEGSDDAYVAQAFGKQGAGAPRRDKDGNVISKHEIIVTRQKHHNEGPADAYAARNFGKSTVPKDDRGNVRAARVAQVSNYKVHHQSSEDSYYAKYFGKAPVPARRMREPKEKSDGPVVRARPRVPIEKQLERETGGEPPEFLKGASGPRQGRSMKKDSEFQASIAKTSVKALSTSYYG